MLRLAGRGARGPRLAPRSILAALAEEHIEHRAVTVQGATNVNRIDNLAVREARRRMRAFGRKRVVPKLVEELLPGRCPECLSRIRSGRDVRFGRWAIFRLERRGGKDFAVAVEQSTPVGLEECRPDVLTDLGAVGVVRTLARCGETIRPALPPQFNPVVARAADDRVRTPLASGNLDHGTGSEVISAFDACADRGEGTEGPDQHQGGALQYNGGRAVELLISDC